MRQSDPAQGNLLAPVLCVVCNGTGHVWKEYPRTRWQIARKLKPSRYAELCPNLNCAYRASWLKDFG